MIISPRLLRLVPRPMRAALALGTVLTMLGGAGVGPVVPLAHATTSWYVNATSGNDSNNCLSPVFACRTIGAGISHAGSGDTVSLAAGTYVENVVISTNITLIGAGRGYTIVDGGQQGPVVTVNATTSSVTIQGMTIQNGSGTGGAVAQNTYEGGGLLNFSTGLVVNNVLITNNTADAPVTVGTGTGGGISNHGTLTLINSTISGNSATFIGAGIYNASGAYILMQYSAVNSNILNNLCANTSCSSPSTVFGGGIYNAGSMDIASSVIDSNGGTYVYGGGIYNRSWANLSLQDSSVAGNYAYGCNNCGAGSTSEPALGGGILNDTLGVMTIDRSAITNNVAPTGFGGGIANASVVTITNTTINLNSAAGCGSNLCTQTRSGGGGGVYTFTGSQTWLLNDTISANQATIGQGGGVLTLPSGNTIMVNSLLATNTADTGGPDCYGTLTTLGYNLLGDPTNCAGMSNGVKGDQVGTTSNPLNPMLDAPGQNGGPTETQSLLPGSPAINAGNPKGCRDHSGAILMVDQRGAVRPDLGSGRCDIGAVEVQVAGLAVLPGKGVANTPVNIKGAGFSNGENVSIMWPGQATPLGVATATDTGNIAIQAVLPRSTGGPHTISALGQTSGITETTTYTVTSVVGLQSKSGPVGSSNAMGGLSFGAHETVQAHWASPTGPLLGTTTTNSVGSFTGTNAPLITFTVPSSAAGAYPVYAVGVSSGFVVSTTFQVTP